MDGADDELQMKGLMLTFVAAKEDSSLLNCDKVEAISHNSQTVDVRNSYDKKFDRKKTANEMKFSRRKHTQKSEATRVHKINDLHKSSIL